MALKRGMVKLEEYNSDWVLEYLKEEKLLKDVLEGFILKVHHIGSTSIKGLKAKSIIDILVLVNSFDNILEIENILNKYGYVNMGHQGINDRYFFSKEDDDARTHYVHMVDTKGDTYYNQILFRDYLNKYSEYVKKYCDLKQELAEMYADDRKKYTVCKSEFISNVIELAKKEYNIRY